MNTHVRYSTQIYSITFKAFEARQQFSQYRILGMNVCFWLAKRCHVKRYVDRKKNIHVHPWRFIINVFYFFTRAKTKLRYIICQKFTIVSESFFIF